MHQQKNEKFNPEIQNKFKKINSLSKTNDINENNLN